MTGEGTGTEEFSKLVMGDKVRILGPLGNGFTVQPGKKAFLIGGGIGVPPMLQLAKDIKARVDMNIIMAIAMRIPSCSMSLRSRQLPL